MAKHMKMEAQVFMTTTGRSLWVFLSDTHSVGPINDDQISSDAMHSVRGRVPTVGEVQHRTIVINADGVSIV